MYIPDRLTEGYGPTPAAMEKLAEMGAELVVTVDTGTTARAALARAKELGATDGVNYAEHQDWAQGVLELTGGAGADVVIDSVGTTWPDSLRCLRKGGRCVVFGATGGEQVTLAPRALYLSQVELRGTTMGSPREFAALLAAIDDGTWVPVVDTVRPLSDAAAAHARMESGDQFGKLVLSTT